MQEPRQTLPQNIACQLISYQEYLKSPKVTFIGIRRPTSLQEQRCTTSQNLRHTCSCAFYSSRKFGRLFAPRQSSIYKHISAFIPRERKVTVRMSAPVVNIKQHDAYAKALFRKGNTPNAYVRTNFEGKDNHGSAIRQSIKIQVAKQKFLELVFLTLIKGTTNRGVSYTLALIKVLSPPTSITY